MVGACGSTGTSSVVEMAAEASAGSVAGVVVSMEVREDGGKGAAVGAGSGGASRRLIGSLGAPRSFFFSFVGEEVTGEMALWEEGSCVSLVPLSTAGSGSTTPATPAGASLVTGILVVLVCSVDHNHGGRSGGEDPAVPSSGSFLVVVAALFAAIALDSAVRRALWYKDRSLVFAGVEPVAVALVIVLSFSSSFGESMKRPSGMRNDLEGINPLGVTGVCRRLPSRFPPAPPPSFPSPPPNRTLLLLRENSPLPSLFSPSKTGDFGPGKVCGRVE